MVTLIRSSSVDARVVQHPFGMVGLENAWPGTEQRRIESDGAVEILDASMRAVASCRFPFGLSWIDPDAAAGCGDAGGPRAAILHEIADEIVHGRVVGAVDDRPVPSLLPHQASLVELGEVEGERRVGHAQGLRDGPRRHPILPRLHEQPEKSETMLLR
jgi:hypothetical protein